MLKALFSSTVRFDVSYSRVCVRVAETASPHIGRNSMITLTSSQPELEPCGPRTSFFIKAAVGWEIKSKLSQALHNIL